MTLPKIIGLDADDTLWHNEPLFRLTHERFNTLLAPWADPATIDATLAEVERRNLATYGYGALKGRTTLARVFLLIDSRHGIKPVDRDIMKMLDAAAVTFQGMMAGFSSGLQVPAA